MSRFQYILLFWQNRKNLEQSGQIWTLLCLSDKFQAFIPFSFLCRNITIVFCHFCLCILIIYVCKVRLLGEVMLYLVIIYNSVSLLLHLLWAVDEMAFVGDPLGLTLKTFYFKLVWTSHDLLRCLRWDLYFSPTTTFCVICSFLF